MSSMKPLMSQPRRHRDRRAGRATEQLRGAFEAPASRTESTRPAGQKRRSLRRLIDRRADRGGPPWKSAGAVLCVVVLATVSLRLVAEPSDLVAFEDAPGSYARLAAAVREACAAPLCVFGWSSPEEPPAEVTALMARVRARDVIHNRTTGRTTVLGSYTAAFSLTHDGAESDEQVRYSRAIATREWLRRAQVEAAGLTPSTRRVRDLSAGWTLWSGRLRLNRPAASRAPFPSR